MTQRRLVRVAPSFFDRLDELLPADRSPTGRPSATDFLLHEMPPIIDLLAEDYQAATFAEAEAPGVRVLVTSGRLVPRVAVFAVLLDDASVEIIYLELDEDGWGT